MGTGMLIRGLVIMIYGDRVGFGCGCDGRVFEGVIWSDLV